MWFSGRIERRSFSSPCREKEKKMPVRLSIRKLSAILARGPTSWEGFLSPRITWPIQIRHTRQRNKKKTENKRNFFFFHHLLLLQVL